MVATTSPYRPAPSPRLDRRLRHLFINLLRKLRHHQPTGFVTLAGPGLCLGEPTSASIAMTSLHRPSGNGCADRVPILGVTFFGLLQINQVLLILVIFACWSLFFPRNYYSGLFLYTGLSNDVRTNDDRVVVRSVSIHSPANAASGTWTDL